MIIVIVIIRIVVSNDSNSNNDKFQLINSMKLIFKIYQFIISCLRPSNKC